LGDEIIPQPLHADQAPESGGNKKQPRKQPKRAAKTAIAQTVEIDAIDTAADKIGEMTAGQTTVIDQHRPSHSKTGRPVKRVRKGHKVQISLTITEEMLDRVDAMAQKLSQSRAGVINLAIYQALEGGVRVGGWWLDVNLL
jgi:predicted transcriptional regulator